MSERPLVVTVPDASYAAELADLEGPPRDGGASVELVAWDMRGECERAAEVRLAVVPYTERIDLPARTRSLTSLEVVQLQTAGYENYLGHVPSGVALCNASGVHDASTAELAVGLAIAAQRQLPQLVTAQAQARWLPTAISRSLADSRVLVLGYGQIGRAIVRRLLPFEVDVTVVASRAREGDDLVEHVHGIDELPDLLAEVDVLVVIVPLTSATHGLVDEALLARLPDGALVVNVARGPVVVTDALLAECATGRLRAALDVTDPEPLPERHPLWSTPGVLLTPHVGGASTAMRPRMLALIRAQVDALRSGRPPANVVNGV